MSPSRLHLHIYVSAGGIAAGLGQVAGSSGQEFAFCRGWVGERIFCTRLSPFASGTLGKEFVSGLEPGDSCHHTPFLHRGLGIGYLLHFTCLLRRSDFSRLLESVSLPLLFQPLSLYLHLLSSVSFPNALLLSPPSSPGLRGEGWPGAGNRQVLHPFS